MQGKSARAGETVKCINLLLCDVMMLRFMVSGEDWRHGALCRSLWRLKCLVFAFDGGWSVFTGSGVTAAKQTGHCGLNNCGLTATICSACLLPLFMPAWP